METLIIKGRDNNNYDITRLFVELGVSYYTKRNVSHVSIWIDSKERNVTKLLDMLGEWDDKDFGVAEKWKGSLSVDR